MAAERRPRRVKLFVGLLLGDIALLPKVKRALVRSFGPIDYESPISEFTHTEYYTEEMGPGLKRIFLGFERLLRLEKIYRCKLGTNSIERRFAKNGRRNVNVDPGCLDMSKVVLFSTKDYIHRIYLGRGVYAEVTLYYKDKRYNAWPWTYPDYRSTGYAALFEDMRNIYRTQESESALK